MMTILFILMSGIAIYFAYRYEKLVKVIPIEIVELPKRFKANADDEDSIRALETHPGFVALVERFRLQAAALETKLRTAHHEDIRDVDSLQAGIKWIKFCQDQIDRLVFKKREATKVKPTFDELQEFSKVFAQFESIKSDSQDL